MTDVSEVLGFGMRWVIAGRTGKVLVESSAYLCRKPTLPSTSSLKYIREA